MRNSFVTAFVRLCVLGACLAACTSSNGHGHGHDAGLIADAGGDLDSGHPTHHDAGAHEDAGTHPNTDSGSPENDASTNDAAMPDGGDVDAGDMDASTSDSGQPPDDNSIVCQQLTAGPCTVAAGDGARVLTGTILTPTKIYRGGQVVIDSTGAILQVGCKADCLSNATCAATAANATSITCPSSVISPGLINTHDHLQYTYDTPHADTGERYEHRHEWRQGLDGHTIISTSGSASADQMAWGELRFLLGGATSTVGSSGVAGLLRNLDKANLEEGLAQAAVDFDTFPLNDNTAPSGFPNAVACSAFNGIVADTDAYLTAADAYEPHVAEGINAYASNELTCLSDQNPGHDVVLNKSAFIHAVGLTASQYASMAANGTGLIWSPRSNLSLYGTTATVTEAARLGVTIALGSDWLPTGSMSLLRELQCADSFNRDYLDGFFSDRDLWLMVTTNAATLTATDDVIGTLAPGKIADVAVFDGSTHHDYRAVIDAAPEDVQLVLRGGKVLYGDHDIVPNVPNVGTCDALIVCGTEKNVCLSGELGKSLGTLQSGLTGIYAAFFCGDPDPEPTCVPSRPAAVNGSTVYTGAITSGDDDGDGIANAQDDCPSVFDPVRPLDNGVQADFDGDGVGDACDPCPLDANVTTCVTLDPNDSDGDTVVNGSDNCPNAKNQDQTDTDSDGKGDVCDACPNDANPGAAVCPVSIYAIKSGSVAAGSLVALQNKLVTARTARGFFLQAKPGDPDYVGADYSGIFVFDSSNAVQAGDRVTITSAQVVDYFGQLQLTNPVTSLDSSLNEAAPAAVVVTAAQVATNGARAQALEGVLVQLADTMVTDINPSLGAGDTSPSHEFVVDDALRVDDELYLVTPFPVLGQGFTSLGGVLQLIHGDSTLEPRDSSDVVAGAPVLADFAPAQSYLYVGDQDLPTVPAALTVTLSNSTSSDTFVAITSGDPSALTITGGGVTVPAGQTHATVLLSGPMQSQNVTLTATLGASMFTALVRVVDPAEQPAIVSLTPAMANIAPGGTQSYTVTLDIPAPVGGASVSPTLVPSNAGTVPATVSVPAGQLSASFDYVDGSSASSLMVTATLGQSMASASLTVGAICAGNHVLISEVRSRGAAGASDEFVELYNPTSSPVILDSSWTLSGRSNAASSYSTRWTGTGKTIPAHGHFLIASSGYTQSPATDEALTSGFTDATSVRLLHSGNVVDGLCYAFDSTSAMVFSSDVSYGCEGAPVTTNPHDNGAGTNTDASLERKPGGSSGNCTDTDDNATDFATLTPANPQNTQSSPTP